MGRILLVLLFLLILGIIIYFVGVSLMKPKVVHQMNKRDIRNDLDKLNRDIDLKRYELEHLEKSIGKTVEKQELSKEIEHLENLKQKIIRNEGNEI